MHRFTPLLLILIAASAPPAVVRIEGRFLDVNGHQNVPRGLLGLHADSVLTEKRRVEWGVDGFRGIHHEPGSSMIAFDKDGNLKPEFKGMPVVIDCQGDRYRPATVLLQRDYEEFYTRIGREYARKCLDRNYQGYAEFWNEPYLNWAERSRRNYDPKFYDVSKATDDGPVTIKGWDKPLTHLRWRRLWAADESGKIQYLVPVPKGAKVGDQFRHRLSFYFTDRGEHAYTVVEKWDVYDPTAPSFWSGKQNWDFYMWMLLPWAKAIKETNPGVQVIAGWGHPMCVANWQLWESLYKPTIDGAIQWIDGVGEHHYGLNPRANAATYEVAVGYAMAEYGKWLHCYNTETAGCEDPAVPGNKHANATPYGAYNYGLRDITELIYRCADKAVSRTSHGSLAPGWGGGGDEFLFKLMKEFRGRLLHTRSDDLDIWPIGAIDGQTMSIIIYNDHPTAREIPLAITAPQGATFSGGKITSVSASEEQGPLHFNEADLPASGAQLNHTLKLVGRSGAKLTLSLSAKPADSEPIRRSQFFARGILKKVTAAQPLSLTVAMDEKLAGQATCAWLRLVLEGVDANEATATINGTDISVPAHAYITDIPIDPKLLKPRNAITLKSSGDGYQLDVASIIVER